MPQRGIKPCWLNCMFITQVLRRLPGAIQIKTAVPVYFVHDCFSGE